MALVLTGIVNGMRPVAGTTKSGDRQGQEWQFLSMEITDTRYGKVYSCQLRDDDPQYKDFVEVTSGNGGKLKTDLTGHKVRVTIKGQSASEREITDKSSDQVRMIMQIRSQLTNIRDLGIPEEDEG